MSSFDFPFRYTRLVATGAVLALAGGLFGAGCGGGLDYPTLTDFCQGAAQADCSGAVVQACFGTQSDQTLQECIDTRSSPDVCNPRQLQYHAEFADACITAHQTLYGSNVLDPTLYQAMRQACLPVLNNGAQTDAACSQDSDCDVGDGFYCIIHQSAPGQPTRGSCQTPVQVQPGGNCDAPSAQCVDTNLNTNTYYCALVNGAHACIQDPIVGDICGSDLPCGSGLYCEASSGRCAAPRQGLAPCSTDDECSGGFCIATSPTAGVCAAMITLGTGSPACYSFGGLTNQ
jgi:Dickkopf N-terminal cysteine-rich region